MATLLSGVLEKALPLFLDGESEIAIAPVLVAAGAHLVNGAICHLLTGGAGTCLRRIKLLSCASLVELLILN